MWVNVRHDRYHSRARQQSGPEESPYSTPAVNISEAHRDHGGGPPRRHHGAVLRNMDLPRDAKLMNAIMQSYLKSLILAPRMVLRRVLAVSDEAFARSYCIRSRAATIVMPGLRVWPHSRNALIDGLPTGRIRVQTSKTRFESGWAWWRVRLGRPAALMDFCSCRAQLSSATSRRTLVLSVRQAASAAARETDCTNLDTRPGGRFALPRALRVQS